MDGSRLVGCRRGRTKAVALGVAITALVLAACGSDDDTGTPTSMGDTSSAPGSQSGSTSGSESDAGTSTAMGTTESSGTGVTSSSSSGEVPECVDDVDCPDVDLGAQCIDGMCTEAPACAHHDDVASCSAATCVWDTSCVPRGKCCGRLVEPDCGCAG